MKKITTIALAIIMAASLAACGRRNNNETSAPTTNATDYNTTIIPDMDATIGTNIPDPNVDTSMPMYTNGTEDTTGTNGTESTHRNMNGATNGNGK